MEEIMMGEGPAMPTDFVAMKRIPKSPMFSFAKLVGQDKTLIMQIVKYYTRGQ